MIMIDVIMLKRANKVEIAQFGQGGKSYVNMQSSHDNCFHRPLFELFIIRLIVFELFSFRFKAIMSAW